MTPREAELIGKLGVRCWDVPAGLHVPALLEQLAVVVAYHRHSGALDLEKLLASSDVDFLHDLAGIEAHYDPEDKRLYHFVPRCIKSDVTVNWERVVFRKYHTTGETIALFVDDVDSGGYVRAYMHDGQYGRGDYSHIMRQTKTALAADYTPLKEELEKMGYHLRHVTRR